MFTLAVETILHGQNVPVTMNVGAYDSNQHISDSNCGAVEVTYAKK